MDTFNSINDFSKLSKKFDKEKFKKILDINLKTGKEITDLLRKNIDFEFSNIGEIFLKLPKNLSKNDKESLGKYFNIRGYKIGSRGVGYYGLFGDAYKVENRGEYNHEFLDSFFNEYNEYIKVLDNLKDNKDFLLLYLDNYRNFVLLWIYILTMINKSSSKQETRPIQNMAFTSIDNDYLDSLVENLVKIYEILIENIISTSLNDQVDNTFMLPNLQNIYGNIKKIFSLDNIVKIKKGKISLEQYFKKNNNNLKIWFEKIFRNVREEDNLGLILSFFLQKNIDLTDLDTKRRILNLVNKFKRRKKSEYILSNMYGGIEFALVAKYLGYDSGLSNFSTYHLGSKDTYKNINDIFFSLSKDSMGGKNLVILDDNIGTGETLEKLRTVLENNHINIKHLAVPRIYLTKQERKNNLHNISEIRKHIALNTTYLLPRSEKNNRNINILVEKKVKGFRKNYGKEFRTL